MTEYDVNNFSALRISLASAEDVRSWSHGEVKKPETINYRTLKPEKDGLFCEKIFGPSKDWECSCGKYKRVRFKGIVCERCGVEVTQAKVRRERMGHIELAAPVSHIWYFKGTPSRLGYLLDIAPKDLEKVLYFASSMITWVDEEARDADVDILREELEADLQELDGERDALIERMRRMSIDYTPEEDEIVDIADDERLTSEEVEEEIADIYEEYTERKALRTEALDTFLKISPRQLITDETLYREMRANYRMYFHGGMGAEAVRELLEAIDLESVAAELKEVIATGKGQKRAKAIKRLKVVDAFLKSDNDPADMILEVLPVIPPDLRPMVQLDGGRFATSDLNDLYRRVINRNNRLKRMLDLGAPEMIVNNEKRMLQEAVDSLFDNGRRGRPVTGPGNRPLKSLADMLKGKQGRFRQNLLGKRVDFSGRSVIVVGPNLKLHQCGLPQQMALELFKPFVTKRLLELGEATNIKEAKDMVEQAKQDIVWDILEKVIVDHPVLLNRAPTLHRLGIQAFEPVLVEGKAIKLHPLVCTAFNADFDGDQMAVHVPLGNEAQAEARVLMLSSNNIKSPAHGKPLTVPTQDMIIGMYYLTTPRDGFEGEGRTFIDFNDALNAYEARAGLDLQARISVRLTADTVVANAHGEFVDYKAGQRLETTVGRIIFNDALPADYPFVNFVMDKKEVGRLIEDCASRYTTSEMGPILDDIKRLGFHYATRAGITVSVYDATIPENKDDILADADAAVAEINERYEFGELSDDERHRHTVKTWTEANEAVGEAMANSFDEMNPIYMMATSGARGNIKQIRQLAGMRGLMAGPSGETIDLPIKANFREGLSVLEYFISTHGARKGLTDTALRTADSGYLTRRLVDVAQDVIVREDDCGSRDGVEYALYTEKGDLDENLIGRCLLNDAGHLKADEYISSLDDLKQLDAAGVTEVVIRTVMTCHAEHGVCQKCYGWDLATGRPVNQGTAVGIIAAQSIGEPGTQLTMRTFHAGGVAGGDITHGLPRVTELFEARKPKGLAVLAEIEGVLQTSGNKDSKMLTVHNQDGEIREYVVSARAQLMPGLKDGDVVAVGQQLTRGSINPHDLLRLTDANTTLRYIVSQVQDVYVSQGVEINDKHIEVIARQMLRKITVLSAGDSDLLPGSQVNRYAFIDIADELIAEGKEPPQGQPMLLGITKASLATDSFLSAASFQETTKVLTDAALEGKVDDLAGLKENVIIGKPIPAGTGLNRYRKVGITYMGAPVEQGGNETLPDNAPAELRAVEELLPQPEDWSLEEGYRGGYYGGRGYRAGYGGNLTEEEARLYLYDDLGVSQRWANKFSEAGIETVGDLYGYTEDELLRIEGIGAKALEELKAGLEEHNLSNLLQDDLAATSDEMSQLLDMVFSPDDTVLIGGDNPQVFSNAAEEEMLGEALPPRAQRRDLSELGAWLEDLSKLGFSETSEEDEAASNAIIEDE